VWATGHHRWSTVDHVHRRKCCQQQTGGGHAVVKFLKWSPEFGTERQREVPSFSGYTIISLKHKCMLYNCLEWYKWVLTNLYHYRQLYNTLILPSHESPAVGLQTCTCISRLSGSVELTLRYTTPDIHCRHGRHECDGEIMQDKWWEACMPTSAQSVEPFWYNTGLWQTDTHRHNGPQLIPARRYASAGKKHFHRWKQLWWLQPGASF